jgi:tRNA(Ile)-lysidine synthase
LSNNRRPDQSWEEFWREERYRFLERLDGPVVTAHHLDDAVETYVWRMCHGRSDTIPYRRNNIIRPFLLTAKAQMKNWAVRNSLQWVEDASNQDTNFTRNHIRHRVIPELLTVNPGLYKIVVKQIKKSCKN